MSEQNLQDFIGLNRSEQAKIKPQIEDIINIYLNGEMKKNALDFVAYVQFNYKPLKWRACNSWETKGGCNVDIESSRWNITPKIDIKKCEKQIVEERLQQIIWNSFRDCVLKNHDGKTSVGCRPTKGCAYGMDTTVFGKEFKGICIHQLSLWRVHNPDAATLDVIKRLLEIDKESQNRE